jgi:hypothetical protein
MSDNDKFRQETLKRKKQKPVKIQEVQEFNLELQEMINDDTMKSIIYTYANKKCKTCCGRGYNDISRPGALSLQRKPCDCAIRRKKIEMDKPKNKPIWGIRRGNAPMEFVYAKSSLPPTIPTEGIFHGKV